MVEAIPEHQLRAGADSTLKNHSISVQPKFFFGLKGDVTNNCIFVDENTVIYPCGHNVILYSMSERVQRYIPGIDGSQGITTLAISPSKKLLAVCEKSTHAICSVYNIQKFMETIKEKKSTTVYDVPLKKRRILLASDDPARKYTSVDFCAAQERHIVTVSEGSESKIIVWHWDK